MGTRIEPREGLEIYATDAGLIALKQLGALYVGDEPIVVIHVDEVETVITGIRDAQRDLTT